MKVACIFRPARGDPKKCIDQRNLFPYRKFTEIWLIGDFNIDFLKRGDMNQKCFLSMFKTFDLSELISDVTRLSLSAG